MQIITREQWNARAPRHEPENTLWSRRTLFVVHYSGANPHQTVRSIQDYHMDVRGWNDIGYNFLVDRLGRLYEGRGWDAIGAHAAGYNTIGLGVCVIGLDHPGVTDFPPAVRSAVRWVYDEANRHRRYAVGANAAKLQPRGHRDLGHTDCPGDELYSWVRAGMPLSGSPTPVPAPAPAPSNLEEVMLTLPTLKLGAKGFPTALVQMHVNHNAGNDAMHPLKVDGDWGPATDAAVRSYQARHKVPNSVRSDGSGDGIWGVACWTYALGHVG